MDLRIKDSALFLSKILRKPGTEWASVEVGWNGDIEESKSMRNSTLFLPEQS
jgi:hypothetical protein